MHAGVSAPARRANQACTSAEPTRTATSDAAPVTRFPREAGALEPRTSGGVRGSRSGVVVATAIRSSLRTRDPRSPLPERGSPNDARAVRYAVGWYSCGTSTPGKYFWKIVW